MATRLGLFSPTVFFNFSYSSSDVYNLSISWESIGSLTPKVEATMAPPFFFLFLYLLHIFLPGSARKAVYLHRSISGRWRLHFANTIVPVYRYPLLLFRICIAELSFQLNQGHEIPYSTGLQQIPKYF